MNLSGSGQNNRPGFSAALRIAMIYGIFALAYILGSDLLLQQLLSEATIQRLSHFQMVKGAAFVLITAILLWFLIRRALHEIRVSQQATAESEYRFRRLVEYSPNGIFIHLKGQILYANDALAKMLGYERGADLINRQNLDLMHPEVHEGVRERMRMMVEKRAPVGVHEQRFLRKDGQVVWVEASALPFDVDGQPGTQVMANDISARKRAEEDLRHLNETLEKRVADRTLELQQAVEDLRTFSYMISHDLRTPLRSISRFAEEILTASIKTPCLEVEDSARRIVAVSARLDRLTLDLFEYSKLARGDIQLQRISLVLVTHEVVGQLRREPDCAQAEFHIREPMPWVLSNRPTLGLVLLNLIHNAVKYVPKDVMPIVTILAEDRGEMVRVIVEDNGIGIDEKRATGIFHLFEQPHLSTETGGTGIGLAIIRRGVDRLGGTVGVESTPNSGSRFWIELPKDPESP